MSEDLRQEVADLRRRVARLEAALREQDERVSADPNVPRDARLDHYDRPVVESLERHETYHVRTLTQRYLTRSQIAQEATAKERVKQLVATDAFEPRGGGDHEFVGWGK